MSYLWDSTHIFSRGKGLNYSMCKQWIWGELCTTWLIIICLTALRTNTHKFWWACFFDQKLVNQLYAVYRRAYISHHLLLRLRRMWLPFLVTLSHIACFFRILSLHPVKTTTSRLDPATFDFLFTLSHSACFRRGFPPHPVRTMSHVTTFSHFHTLRVSGGFSHHIPLRPC